MCFFVLPIIYLFIYSLQAAHFLENYLHELFDV